MDRVIPFPGWTLPGVFTMGGSQVALKAQGCAIGDPVVFMGTGPLLYLVAYQYAHAGRARGGGARHVPFVPGDPGGSPVCSRAVRTFAKGLWYMTWLRAAGIAVRAGITPVAAEGDVGPRGRALPGPARDANTASHAPASVSATA